MKFCRMNFIFKKEIIQVLHSVNIDYDMDLLYKTITNC